MKIVVLALCLSALLVSCTTAATKGTAGKPSVKTASKKNGKAVGGMTTGRPPESGQEAGPQTPVEHILDLEARGEYLRALRELVNLSVTAPTKQEQNASRQRAIEIVENKLDDKQLEEVADDSDYGFLRGNAMYRLGERAIENRDAKAARKYFSGVAEYLPGSDLALRAQDLLADLESIRSVSSKTIGVVLPLSGKNAQVGQRALRGVEMGLGLHLPGSGFKLAVIDSEGNPDTARRGVERLVKEDNAIAIVGSLLSKTAPAVAAKANEMGVPTIALSQRSGLTEVGPTVFRNALTSTMQIRHLVRTAMEDMGMKRFAVLYPNDPYGVEFTNIFWDEVLARGGQVTAAQTYSNKETDFRLPIQRLVGTYYGEARDDEFKIRMRELQHSGKKGSIRQSNLQNVLPPIADFDAIFVPDSAKSLGQISAMLAYSDVRGVKLLGTNLWNTPSIAKRLGNVGNNIIFVDSFIAAGESQERSRFISEYKSLFNEEPSLIEIQAYDSALILRQLVASGSDSRESLVARLSGLKKFPGAIGTLNMNSEREIERPVVSLTINNGEITPLKVRK